MNLDRYEKIDGREALKRLADGEYVFMELINETVKLKLTEDGLRCDVAGYENQVTYWTFNQIYTSGGLYIPKPFDVRQAMLDRPNEWVGAYEFSGSWFKVGFDSNHMVAIETGFKNDVPVMYHNEFADHVEAILLNTCIPIEDVPEEATR